MNAVVFIETVCTTSIGTSIVHQGYYEKLRKKGRGKDDSVGESMKARWKDRQRMNNGNHQSTRGGLLEASGDR